MAGSLRMGGMVLALVLTPLTAQAYWPYSSGYWGSYSPFVYPVYSYSQWPMTSPAYGYGSGYGCGYGFAPTAQPARPTVQSLPKQTTSEPPLGLVPKRGPVISDSHSGSGEHTAKKQIAKGQYRVGFWNVTGRDVRLTVNGQDHKLQRDRAVTLQVARNFSWQVDDGRERNELIPEGQSSYEVVIRP